MAELGLLMGAVTKDEFALAVDLGFLLLFISTIAIFFQPNINIRCIHWFHPLALDALPEEVHVAGAALGLAQGWTVINMIPRSALNPI